MRLPNRILSALAAGALLAGPAVADHEVTPQEYLRFQEGMRCFANQEYDRALGCWMPLAQVGVAEAQYNIGRMYAYGEGVPLDLAEAYAWFVAAARNGRSIEARQAMDQLRPHMTGEQIAQAYRRADAIGIMVEETRPAPGS